MQKINVPANQEYVIDTFSGPIKITAPNGFTLIVVPDDGKERRALTKDQIWEAFLKHESSSGFMIDKNDFLNELFQDKTNAEKA